MKRTFPDVRADSILGAALACARRSGYDRITRREVAAEARCSEALVSYHWRTMCQLRRSVMRRAVRDRDLRVVAQGLAARDPQAQAAPEDLRRAALASLT